MAGFGVPTRPEPAQLDRLAVGRAVSARHGRHWNHELTFLLAHNVHPVVNAVFNDSGARTVKVAYNRSPGVQVLLVEYELGYGPDESTLALSTFTVTASSGTVAALDDNGFLDGSAEIQPDSNAKLNRSIFRGFLDVTGLTVGTTVDLIFTYANVSTDPEGAGLYRLSVMEVPLADVSPVDDPTTEVGLEPVWSDPRRAIVDGSTTGDEGFVRLTAMLDKARSQVRRYWQWITTEGTAAGEAWRVTATAAGTTFPFGGSGSARTFKSKARHLYTVGGSMQPETTQIRVRYNNSGIGCTLRCVVTPVGGAAVNTDISLPNAGASWDDVTAELLLPTTGTGQEFTIQFQAWNSGAGTTYVSQIAIISNEV
jgi:hypothetical protein